MPSKSVTMGVQQNQTNGSLDLNVASSDPTATQENSQGSTSQNIPQTIVLRDLSGGFSCGSIDVSGEIYINGSGLSTTLSAEVSSRVSGDVSLSSGLFAEVSSRVSGDVSLSSGLSAEVSSRVSGDVSLSSGLSAEVSSRVSGDVSLSSGLSAEVSRRTSADISLSTAISSITGGGITSSSLVNTQIFDPSLVTFTPTVSFDLSGISAIIPSNSSSIINTIFFSCPTAPSSGTATNYTIFLPSSLASGIRILFRKTETNRNYIMNITPPTGITLYDTNGGSIGNVACSNSNPTIEVMYYVNGATKYWYVIRKI